MKSVLFCTAMLVGATCERAPVDAGSKTGPGAGASGPAPEYIPCDQLGGRRFDPTFCVHAERVRVEDHNFALCRGVEMNPEVELWLAIEDEIRRGLARQQGREATDFEVVNGEGMQAIVTIDVCFRRACLPCLPGRCALHERLERERPEDVVVAPTLDRKRPLRVQLHALRGVSYRIAGSSETLPAEVGEWPRRMQAPPIEWHGHPSCAELPRRFTESHVCVRAEHVRAGPRPFGLCDRVTVIPSPELVDWVEVRIREHLWVGEHSDERFIDVELDEAAGYVMTVEACVPVPSDGRPPTRVRGGVDARGGAIQLEIEQARFRYRYAASGPFLEGSIGIERAQEPAPERSGHAVH